MFPRLVVVFLFFTAARDNTPHCDFSAVNSLRESSSATSRGKFRALGEKRRKSSGGISLLLFSTWTFFLSHNFFHRRMPTPHTSDFNRPNLSLDCYCVCRLRDCRDEMRISASGKFLLSFLVRRKSFPVKVCSRGKAGKVLSLSLLVFSRELSRESD